MWHVCVSISLRMHIYTRIILEPFLHGHIHNACMQIYIMIWKNDLREGDEECETKTQSSTNHGEAITNSH